MDFPKIRTKQTQGVIKEGLNRFIFYDGQLFFLYVPRGAMARPAKAKILVSVHGYSGRRGNSRGRARVQRYAECWTDMADSNRWVVLAPHFDEKRFGNDYQRLNLSGLRADGRLNALVEETAKLIPGVLAERFLMFGFSGGGQFVHRYIAFNPGRVERAVCAAPGWYMWPDRSLPYPLGIAPNSFPGSLRPQLRGLCKANLLVVVGENDSSQGAFRKSYKEHNLVTLQGWGRRERAENWIAALKQYAEREASPFRLALKVIHKTRHANSQRLLECAGKYLCGE